MFTFKLSIPTNPKKRDKINEVFNLLLGCFRLNGQILGKEQISSLKDGLLSYIILCPEKNSLHKKYTNKYVKKYLEELENIAKTRLIIEILGQDINSPFIECKSKKPFFILYTNYFLINSPLYSGDCFCPVPLYQIPPTKEEEFYDILSWESEYKACDTLQMGCMVGEKFGLQQMSNFDSQLTQKGLEICKKIQKKTGKPTYYYLFNYRKISLNKDREKKCPSCGEEWLLKKALHDKFDFQCKKCYLLSNLTCNS